MTENTDDFIIGDRVWVNGTKPGYIQYIGETKFASGEWAGVVLDDPLGKNDGTIRGVRYFQCDPKRGVFARLYRLTRYPLSDDYKLNGTADDVIRRTTKSTPNGRITTTTTRYVKPTVTKFSTPSYTYPARPSKVVTTVTTTTTNVDGNNNKSSSSIRVGDRVFVNSSRGIVAGRVRYTGRPTFALGQWIGVELDEPYGKNDGSVAGKR